MKSLRLYGSRSALPQQQTFEPDIRIFTDYVRFSPGSGHEIAAAEYPLRTRSGHGSLEILCN